MTWTQKHKNISLEGYERRIGEKEEEASKEEDWGIKGVIKILMEGMCNSFLMVPLFDNYVESSLCYTS